MGAPGVFLCGVRNTAGRKLMACGLLPRWKRCTMQRDEGATAYGARERSSCQHGPRRVGGRDDNRGLEGDVDLLGDLRHRKL